MNLESIWKVFIDLLNSVEQIDLAYWKKNAGIPFLYLQCKDDFDKETLEYEIRLKAAKAMKGKQLHCESIFVRTESNLYVYRHRFFVPQQKMFCCGNICDDCIRLKPYHF